MPPWYETGWFLVLSISMAVLLLSALCRLRVRQVARALSARCDERLAERTRMARELHETVLQTVQGSKMVADNALNRPDDGSDMRRVMEQVSTWLGQASTEGQSAVIALRDSTVETNNLAESFRRAIEDCRRQGSLLPSLAVTGKARDMHPTVRDDVYRIAYEAIRNACTHSGGNCVGVELSYARDLTVRVSDDGVGIDPAMASPERKGPSGLSGMRERAARIDAALDIVTSSDRGTKVTLVVPGRLIFRDVPSLLDRIKELVPELKRHLLKITGRSP
jgi:signal transduction histidine kinase